MKKISVFALDDDPGDLVLLSRYLEDISGWQVEFNAVSNWPDGQVALMCRDIDVIFLDYLLGEDTGLTVVRALRESGDTRPVIILTGQGDERIAAEITRAGADDYLVKSELSPDLLRRTISNVLAQFQLKKEQALLREGLQQAQKMETIGALAGGIAHDFNNMLTAMVGHVEIARMKDTENRCEDNLLKIKSVCRQMTDLVQRLLSFSGKRTNEKSLIDFRLIIEEAKTVLFHSLSRSVQIFFDITDAPLYLHANSAMLHQILLNLCTNGVEAMPEGGTLTIRVRKISVSDDMAALSPPLVRGEYVLLEVEDTGSGIPGAIINKIFDPFFTTKGRSASKGTGLGLAVAWQNLKEHNGYIFVESEVGKGSIFRVYLPFAKK